MAVKFIKKILTSLNLVSSERRALENSFTGKKICHFSKTDSDEMCGHLHQIARHVCGIQKEVDLPAMAYIMRMLNRYYGNLTLADVNDAFEMRAAGELGLIEHYGSFSAEFIGSVLKKYAALRNATLHRYKQKAEHALPQPTNYVSNEHVYNSLIIWVKWQKKIPVIWLWDAAYQYLVEREKLLPEQNMQSRPTAAGENADDTLSYEQKQGLVIRHLVDMFPELTTN